MSELIIGLLLGAAVAGYAVWKLRGTPAGREPSVQIFSTIEDIRSIGELSVFKLVTKEIVTASDHSFGDVGKKYFEWIVSSRKMAMIIAFDIDFRYDLRSSAFSIAETGEGTFRLTMPPCFYETHIKDIHFYDEQNSKLMPWLLPDLLNRAFVTGFSEQDKNRLIAEAKNEASVKAGELVAQMRSEVQKSAREAIVTIAKGFGVREVSVDFSDSELVAGKVEYLDAGTEAA